MFFLSHLSPFFDGNPYALPLEATIDAFILLVILFPSLYFLSLRPMILTIRAGKKTEKALRSAQAEHRSLVDNLSELVYSADPETMEITYINNAISELYGFSREEWLINPTAWKNTTHPDDIERMLTVKNNAKRKAKSGIVSYRAIDKNKRVRWLEDHFSWRKNEEGLVVALDGVVYDRTEHMNVQHALKASEIKFKALYNSSSDAIMMLAPPKWFFTAGNPATIKMFVAKDENEFVSKAPSELSPEYQPDGKPSAQKSMEMINKAMVDGFHLFDWIHKRLNGEEFPATVLLTKVTLDKKYFLQATVRDETIRVKNEEKIRILSQSVEKSPSTIVITDLNNNIEYANPTFSEITGYTREEIIGKNPRTLNSGETPHETFKVLWDTVLSGEKWHGEFHNKKKNGELYWESASISTIKDHEGKVIRYIKVAEDITEKKRMQESLKLAKETAETANRAKSQFLANMSHELRTPLNAIIGFSEVLMKENYGELNEKQADYTNDIFESGKHLLLLINDILDLSKVEANKLELKLTEFDLGDTIQNSTIMIKEKTLKHGITLSIEIDDDVKEILADERMIKQILYNLLSNAAKFTPDGGKIKIKAKLQDNEYLVTIEDTGIGIESKYEDRIFKVFEQLDSDMKRTQKGTGLGLALSKKLIELHGGKIWFKSEGKDKGTTFYFSIPTKI